MIVLHVIRREYIEHVRKKSFIWSTILRVPITFPPDNFYGAQLSAMCVPDLLGT